MFNVLKDKPDIEAAASDTPVPLWQVGSTRVFYKSEVARILDRSVLQLKARAAVLIQALARGYFARLFVPVLRAAVRKIKTIVEEKKWEALDAALDEAQPLGVPRWLLQQAIEARNMNVAIDEATSQIQQLFASLADAVGAARVPENKEVEAGLSFRHDLCIADFLPPLR